MLGILAPAGWLVVTANYGKGEFYGIPDLRSPTTAMNAKNSGSAPMM
jgi:hypothetical protein